MTSASDHFPSDTKGLQQAGAPELVELADTDQFDLRIAPVAKRLGDAIVRMLAYNGSIPGPTLKVPQGSELVVNVVNDGDLEATVHWHGLRLENRYDGTAETQRPMPVGGSFTYRLTFPDPGVYWYHPHIREDYAPGDGPLRQHRRRSLRPGLLAAGQPRSRPHARRRPHRGRKVAPFSRSEPTYTAMGRFGNVMLVYGEPELSLWMPARRGRAPLPDEHRQHARLQRWATRRADEARRRRQRTLRARGRSSTAC